MAHNTPLMSVVVVGFVLAFVLGALAQRLRISPLVGYLLAGVVMGPFTPGFVADQNLANELAEIGIILLMFGVGLHFSLKELLSVRAIAIPGAVAQIVAATLLGMVLAWMLGWTVSAGLVFGLALSVASTVVLLRALQERRLVKTERGRIAVGWLIVEDIVTVVALVLLPVLGDILKSPAGTASFATVAWPLALTVIKVGGFVFFMLIVGRRVVPWILHYVAHTGSRELFRLAVLAISLGVAFGAAILFDVSFALGAFFAGMILSESELSHRAAQETLPLRDAFAVLFFVSVGMLVDPAIVLRDFLPLLATVFVIVIGKSVAAFAIVRLFGHSKDTALTISASLAQIGEFSFILAGLGVSLGLLPERGRDLILAGAIVSIFLNPVCFALLDRLVAAPEEEGKSPEQAKPAREPLPKISLADHVVLVGHGRVGRVVVAALRQAGTPFVVIEDDARALDALRAEGAETIAANGAAPDVLEAANVGSARALLIAIPDAFEGGRIVERARKLNLPLPIIARAHSDEEVLHLKSFGANVVIMGENEIARAMIAQVETQATPSAA
jgi:CPA2 family monovalent cation:H+ antiporter-2